MFLNLTADPCNNYQNLGYANRKSNNATPKFDPVFFDDEVILFCESGGNKPVVSEPLAC